MLFGGLAGLPGAQHNAYIQIVDVFADVARQIQARVFRFHDHIQQDQRNIVGGGQHGMRLFGAVAVDEMESAPIHFKSGHDQFGDLMNSGIVVEHQHLPRMQVQVLRIVALLVTKHQFIVHGRVSE